MTDSCHTAHEVALGLWMGGEWSRRGWLDARSALRRCVVSCAHDPSPGHVEDMVHRYPFNDTRLPSPEEILRAVGAAQCVARNLERGDVLMTCTDGLNSSGLVVALALRLEGYTPQEAIEAVREARGPDALRNPAFERLVKKLPDTMLHEEDE